ncbi:MAG: DUF1552 domain-containing protein [Deltaproteobacteria bacterium]|nr:DUF1552 domain-containing protein [Deltaproteobacteria bacterium]
MNHWSNDPSRRRILAQLGVGAALPFLGSLVGGKRAVAAPKRLTRLVVVSQAHMSLGYHRIPEFCNGAWGNADPSRLKANTALGLRVAAFGTEPAKLGSFYGQGLLKSSARLQKEMMVCNGLGATYQHARGHLSDGNGEWTGGNQSGKFNLGARYPLSGSVHEPMITMDQLIAKKLHMPGQRILFMGSGVWGDSSANTNESVNASGTPQTLIGRTNDIFNGPIFDAGKKITQAQQMRGMTTSPVGDPKATMSAEDFAASVGLAFNQGERQRLLADASLSSSDRNTLNQYYDLLAEASKSSVTPPPGAPSGSGSAASSECKAPELGPAEFGSYLKLLASAFLCDLSKVAFISVGAAYDHNSEWHVGADGDASKVGMYNVLADQVAKVADLLATLTDPATGRDMLETTLVLGITNSSMALKTDDRDPSHEMGDYSYFSVGGSAALNTGFMYDAMGVNGGKRTAINGPIPTVNQYLQTIGAAYGLTPAEWAGTTGKGFGPWLSNTWKGRSLRVDDMARTTPIPGLLVT